MEGKLSIQIHNRQSRISRNKNSSCHQYFKNHTVSPEKGRLSIQIHNSPLFLNNLHFDIASLFCRNFKQLMFLPRCYHAHNLPEFWVHIRMGFRRFYKILGTIILRSQKRSNSVRNSHDLNPELTQIITSIPISH